jgi:hypothetical protein
VSGQMVLVEHRERWVPGVVLFEYVDVGRLRALVRYELPGGLIVRRLHWRDELRAPGVVLELQLRLLAEAP